MRIIVLSLTFLVSFINLSQSLVDEEYFSNPLSGHLTKINKTVEVEDGFIIAGQLQSLQNGYQGVVLRINQIGEVVWSSLTQPQQINCTNMRDIVLFDDGFVYVQGCYEITKINANSGEIEWNTPIQDNNLTGVVIDFYDYDSTRFIIRYNISNSDAHLAFINKSSGDTLQTVEMVEGDPIFNKVAVDHFGNIYFGSGNKIIKFNGDNLLQPIWERSYNADPNAPDKIDVITELYIDAEGYMFIIGYDGTSSTSLILAKVNPVNGNVIWQNQISGNNKLMDFKDQFGYLFMTYGHKYVGGAISSFYTSKIDKDTGVEMWYSIQDMDPLSGVSCTGQEAAKAIEVDCNGNVYLTGYYGDANYGPALWGIMKLNSGNGSKIYDLTITQDSLICDDVSEGKDVNIVAGVPIFVGNEEVSPYTTKATFTSIDPLTGVPGIRHHIGADFQQHSYTKSIQESKDTMFLLMQKGDHAALAMRTSFGISNWEFMDVSIERSKVGCISINDNSAYMALSKVEVNNNAPGDFSNVNAIMLYKINRVTGVLMEQDSLLISGNIELLEMESDALGEAFLLFSDGNNVQLIKWGSNGISQPIILSGVTNNVLSGRSLDVLNNYSSTHLLFSGNQNLYLINKSSLASSSVYQYSSSRNVYGLMHEDGSLVISGENGSGSQFIISLDTITYTPNWDQSYGAGVIAGTIYDQDTIYTYGELNGEIQVQAILASTGVANWEYLRPNLSATYARSNGLSFSSSLERFVVYGSEVHSNGSSDLAIDGIDRAGNGSSILFIEDDLGLTSQANAAAVLEDSMLWVGGRINTTLQGKEGVNYLIQLFDCPIINSIDVVSGCDSYTWINGNTYTNSNNTATVTLVSALGCDSIVTLDLTMNYSTSSTDTQFACEELTWLDGNVYTTDNNTATWMLTSSAGCDSLITLNLAIGDVNTGVTDNSPTLSAVDAGAQYQWLDCYNGYNIVSGETNQSFTATANGNYAVIITDGSCVDTSDCYTVSNVGINALELTNDIKIFPNPTSQDLFVDLGHEYSNLKVEVFTVLGKKVYNKYYQSANQFYIELTGAEGVYLINIESMDLRATFRVIKQ